GGADGAEAATAYEEARRLLRQLVAEPGALPAYRGDLGITEGNLGLLRGTQEKWEEARPYFDRAVAGLKEALRHNPDSPYYRTPPPGRARPPAGGPGGRLPRRPGHARGGPARGRRRARPPRLFRRPLPRPRPGPGPRRRPARRRTAAGLSRRSRAPARRDAP